MNALNWDICLRADSLNSGNAWRVSPLNLSWLSQFLNGIFEKVKVFIVVVIIVIKFTL